MFRPHGSDLTRGWPGRIEGDHVVQLAAQTLGLGWPGALARSRRRVWLRPGDRVELEIERIGALVSIVAPSPV
jgi:2-keto-4-pentenoate hydratase/2-oxohepta-3-ene-1,7-dioic acid hydratase in catechol pathway